MRYRRNVKDLSPAEKTAFCNALLALKKKPSVLHPGDATLHRYDDYAELHMNAMMAQVGNPNSQNFKPGWAHNAPAFFPWHRKLLLEFENDLVAIDASVTVPFWDWSDPAASPLTADFLGSDGDPTKNGKVMDGPFAFNGPNQWTIQVKDNAGDPNFLQRALGQDPTAQVLPSAGQVGDAINNFPVYEVAPWHGSTGSFRSQVEYALHNLVHRWVGGTMGNMTSPNDPVFFLHHCNIDRLWALWQQQNPGSVFYLPINGGATGHNLNDPMIFNLPGQTAPWAGSVTPADCIDNLALGYTYGNPPLLKPNFPVIVHIPAAYVQILVGVINDAPGIVRSPDGTIHHVPGGPGDPVWQKLAPQQRDAVVGHALAQIAPLVSSAAAKKSLQQLGANLAQAR